MQSLYWQPVISLLKVLRCKIHWAKFNTYYIQYRSSLATQNQAEEKLFGAAMYRKLSYQG